VRYFGVGLTQGPGRIISRHDYNNFLSVQQVASLELLPESFASHVRDRKGGSRRIGLTRNPHTG
jgi:hypothetical protein